MLNEYDIDLEDIESRLYSQVYHLNSQDDVDAGIPFVMSSDAPRKVSNYSISNIPTRSTRYFEKNPQDFEIGTNINETYVGPKTVNVESREKELDHNNSAVISRNKPSSISVDVNVTSNNPVQFLNQQVPNNLQQAIPQFLVNPINNIVVFPQNQKAIISVLEKQNRSIKRLQQNARKEEKRRQRKIQKQLFGSRKFQRQQQNNTNVSVMEETICLSDSDDDCCVYIPPVHPMLNLVDSDEEFKQQVKSIVPATNSSSEDVVIIPNPSIEVIDIDADPTTCIPSNFIVTPQKSYLPAERNELLSTPESNDFLEPSVVSVSNEGNFNFSLHGADFSNEDFLRPAAPVNYEHDTESSCSASTCDLNTPSKVVKFSEVEFPSEKNDLFSDANLQKFGQSITPKRPIVTHNKSKQNKNDEGSSSDSDNDDTVRKSKLLSKTLPTLSDIQFESSSNAKTDERKEKKTKKKNKNNETHEEPAKISKKRKSDQPADLTQEPNLELEFTKKKKKKSKKHKEVESETISNDNNEEILKENTISEEMKISKDIENLNLPEVVKKPKKKKNITDFEETTIDQVVLTAETEEIDDNKKRKKKKRAASMTDENSEAALSEASVGPSEEGRTKKKKKKKNKSDIELELGADVEQEVEATVSKKKKKKYRSESDPETIFKEDMTENTESNKKKKTKKHSKENILEPTEDSVEPVSIKKKKKKSKEFEDINIPAEPTEIIIKEKRKKSKNSETDPENIDNNNDDVVVEKIKHKKKKKHSESEPENLVYEETKTKHKKKKQKDLDNIDKFIEVQEELTENPKRKNKESKSLEEPMLEENTTIEQVQKTKLDKSKRNKDPEEPAQLEELPNEKSTKKKKKKEATNAIDETSKESVAVEVTTKPDKKKKAKEGPSVLCLEDMELPIEETVPTEEKYKKKKKRVKNDSICSFASDNLDHSFSGNRSIFEEPRFAADENLEQNSRRIIIQQLINHQEKVLNLSEPSNLFAESSIENSTKPHEAEASLEVNSEPVIKSEAPTTEIIDPSEVETIKTVKEATIIVKETTKTLKEITKNIKENTLVIPEKGPVILPAPIKEEKIEPELLPTTETDDSVNTESNTNIIIEGNVLITTVKQEEIVTLSTTSLPTNTTLLTTSVIPIAAGSAISEKENHVESINNKSNEDTPMCIISHVGSVSDIKTEIISEEIINSSEETEKMTQIVDAPVPDEKLNQDVKTNTNVVNQQDKETETTLDARETSVLSNENITTNKELPELKKIRTSEIESTAKTPPKTQTAIVSVIEDLTVVDEIFSSDEDENDIISIEDSDVESVLSTLDNVGHDIALNCSDKIIEITDTPKTIAEKEESTTSFEERLRNFDVDVLQSKMSNNPKLWRVRSMDTQMYRSEPMRGKRCNKCREIGHMAIRCPNKVGPPKCSLCGNAGHLEPRCPNKLCNQCGERSDYHTNGCIFCRNFPNIQCNICKMMGHPDEKCPDVWRRYHLTTQNGSIVVPKNPRLKKRNDLWCCACAKPGHLEHNCRYYNRSYPPSDPSIHSYEDVYNPGHGFNNRDLNAPSTSAAAQYVPLNESVPPAPKIPPLLSDAAIAPLRTRGYCSRVESRPETTNRNENRPETTHRNEIGPEISGTARNQNQENKSLTVSVLKQLTTFDQTSYHFKLFTTKSPKEIQDYLYSEFQTLENLKISPMALFKQHKTMEKMLLKPSLSPSKLGQLKAHFRKCNMVILGQEALNGGTVHLNKLKNFVFHDTGLLDSYKRETLLLSYEYIFGKRKNDDCKYSYLLKLLVTKYGSKKY